MARRRPRRSLPEIAFGACAIGIALLLVPKFMRESPMAHLLAVAAQTPGRIALGIGVVLLALHFAIQFMRSRGNSRPSARTPRTAGRTVPSRAPARVDPTFTTSATPGTRAVDSRERLDQGWQEYLDRARAARGAAPENLNRTPQRPTHWGPEVFAAIEWRRFERVCEALFGQAGFKVQSHPAGPDGGVDIWLYSAHAADPVAVVQCKHWRRDQVTVKELREFLGVMTAHGLTRGTYATSSTFTRSALEFARDNGINAQDGAGLLRLIGRRTPQQQAELLAVALEGEYWRPTCPSCDVKMVQRPGHAGRKPFWGCPHFPRCRFTLPFAAAGRKA